MFGLRIHSDMMLYICMCFYLNTNTCTYDRYHLVHHLVALKLLVKVESMAMAQDSFNESISNEMNNKKDRISVFINE